MRPRIPGLPVEALQSLPKARLGVSPHPLTPSLLLASLRGPQALRSAFPLAPLSPSLRFGDLRRGPSALRMPVLDPFENRRGRGELLGGRGPWPPSPKSSIPSPPRCHTLPPAVRGKGVLGRLAPAGCRPFAPRSACTRAALGAAQANGVRRDSVLPQPARRPRPARWRHAFHLRRRARSRNPDPRSNPGSSTVAARVRLARPRSPRRSRHRSEHLRSSACCTSFR